MSMEGHDMSAMSQSDGAKTASLTGTVAAIDVDAGTITVDHEPVAELGWPQMVMAFDASEEVRRDIEVGDSIDFTIESTDEGNTITVSTRNRDIPQNGKKPLNVVGIRAHMLVAKSNHRAARVAALRVRDQLLANGDA